MSKFKRQRNSITMTTDNDSVDLISKLPDDLLSFIISFLPIREAVRTGILSRRWRHVWSSILDLHFDTRTILGYGNNIHPFIYTPAFVEGVNRVLAHHRGPVIESFSLDRWLNVEFSHDIDRWIQFAIDKRVKKLELRLIGDYMKFRRYAKLYQFPHWLFSKCVGSALKHLSLKSCLLSLPSKFCFFRSLESIVLEETQLTQENIHNILSNSVCLSRLSINLCFCPIRLVFTGGDKCLNLKQLIIRSCKNLMEVKICENIYLTTFEYSGGQLSQIVCKNNAGVANLCCTLSSRQLAGVLLGCIASKFSQLEILSLHLLNIEEDTIHRYLPTFPKLKHLVLSFCHTNLRTIWFFASALLKASPHVHKLEIDLHSPTEKLNCPEQEKVFLEESSRHEHLKEVVLHSVRGIRQEVDLVENLVNYAPTIETIKVFGNRRCYLGNDKWNYVQVETEVIRKRKVLKMFRRKIPSTICLIILQDRPIILL